MENEHELGYETLTRVYLGSYEHYKGVVAEVEHSKPGFELQGAKMVETGQNRDFRLRTARVTTPGLRFLVSFASFLYFRLLKGDEERLLVELPSDDEFVGDEKNNSIIGDANDHVSESSFMNENIENVINEQEPPQDKISEDPFGIYNILNKQDNKEAGQDIDPSHPPGFTQEVNVGVSVNRPVGSQNVSGVNRSFSLKIGGSIMDVIENLVEVGQTMGYNMAGCKKNLEDIVASHGDSMVFK
ncbi:hypothetical protein Tco_1432792 [Tanacetum coccineum]